MQGDVSTRYEDARERPVLTLINGSAHCVARGGQDEFVTQPGLRRVAYPSPMLRQFSTTLGFDTPGRGLFEITRPLADWVLGSGLELGLLTLFVRHTSASLLVQENVDPDVRGDLDRFLARLVPDGDSLFRHRDEGADDMSAHVRAALSAVQLSIPISDGRLALGTWQGIYLWEHRLGPHRREVALHLVGS
jgi:secondary thiamine-phosphate synthase enzyme